MKRATRRPAASLLAAAVLSGILALAPARGPSTFAQNADRLNMVATVRAVDTKTRTIEVITGVGYAMRVVRLEVAHDCEIKVPWAAAHLSSFVPGTYVRLEYVVAPAAVQAEAPPVVVVLEAFDPERGGVR